MIISLTGFMGCGKSSVGRKLSELLCCSFIDLDDVIVEKEGRSIPEIFASDGEAAFRQMEFEALKQIITPSVMSQCAPLAPSHFVGVRRCQFRTSVSSPEDNMLVLALGGGAVMTRECAEIVREQTICIYLRASIETLMEHLEDQTMNRPLLNNSERPDCHFERAERDEKSAMRDRITNMMAQRSETYEKTAHIIVDTDGKSIETIASEIASKLKLI